MATAMDSHEPVPLREGGKEVVPVWPEEHAERDHHRRLKKRESRRTTCQGTMPMNRPGIPGGSGSEGVLTS